jgi:hypothetical protein
MSTPANFGNAKPSIDPANAALLIESYGKAQKVVKNHEVLDSQP